MADVQQVTPLVEASPGYLARRMSFLESRLGGNQRMVLTASPSATEKKLERAQHVQSRVSIWKRPYETAALRQTEDDSLLDAARAELFPLQGLVKPDTDMASDKVAGPRGIARVARPANAGGCELGCECPWAWDVYCNLPATMTMRPVHCGICSRRWPRRLTKGT